MRRPAPAVALAAMALSLTTGCATVYLRRAPSSPREPWPLAAEARRPSETPPGSPAVAPDHVYTLPELIDLAESNNPDTRIGWQRARQAALAVGIPMAGYFPLIQALTFVAYQHTMVPVPNPSQVANQSQFLIGANPSPLLPTISFPLPMLPQASGSIGVDTWQVLPFLLVNLEIFNLGRFGEVQAAKNNSTSANALFTAVHEKVIFDVASAYFRLNAARTQVAVSRDALERTRAIAKAAEARIAQGVANVVEVSEARREVAQGEYYVAQAQTVEIAAYAALVSAIGIDPKVHLDVAANPSGPLPLRLEQKVDDYVGQALTARADLRAAKARLPATGAGVSRSKAAYAPRVDVYGTAGGAVLGGSIDGVDLPTLRVPIFTAGVNFSWLFFDGGLREVQAEMARSQHAEAEQQLLKLEHQVVQEVVTAYNEVNASLSRYQASTALFETAATAENAATKAYLNGLATLTDAMNAQKARALASATKEQAFADALVATTTLAFAAGELISAKTVSHSH
jgi:outer membrane protein TolC